MKEIELIEKIKKRSCGLSVKIKTGIGDDCAVLGFNKEKYQLVGTDMLVEGTHFDLRKCTFREVGYKAVAVNVSDIAAMGGEPEYITVSIGVPPKVKEKDILCIYDGVFELCNKYGISLIGGDTNKSVKLTIAVSIIGFVKKSNLALRSKAKKGDLVCITSPVRNGRKEHMRFLPRLKEAKFLTDRGGVKTMIDVSDGIALDMRRICSESGVGCRLYADLISISKGSSMRDALYYGESFELLFTVSADKMRKLLKYFHKMAKKPFFDIIGEIVEKREGICLVDERGVKSPLKQEGFEHL